MRKSILLMGLTIAAPAMAIPIPGADFTAIPLSGTTAAQDPSLAGSVIVDRMVPFGVLTGAPGVHGKVQMRVLRGSSGMLDFYWRVLVDANSTGSVDQFAVRNFPKLGYDTGWRLDALPGVAPANVVGGSGTGPAAWVIGYQFATPIAPGQTSRFIYLRTRDHNFASDPNVSARLRGPGGFVATIPIVEPRP